MKEGQKEYPSAEKRQGDCQSEEEKQRDHQPGEEKRRDYQPVEEKRKNYQPVEEKRKNYQPVEEKQRDSQLAEEKQMDSLQEEDGQRDRLPKEERIICDGRLEEILAEMRKRFEPDAGLIRRAYSYALQRHGSQRRTGGSPYMTHPLEVAMILAKVGFESDLIAAALLHDVIEDCQVTKEMLAERFGEEIAQTVDALSSLKADSTGDPEIQKDDLDALSDMKFLTETVRKENRKALYIKLADRIHNLRTIADMPEEKQHNKVLHTRNVLIPAAKELHVYKLVDTLETLCLQIENPAVYEMITQAYKKLLRENAFTLQGEDGLRSFFLYLIRKKDEVLKKYIVSLEFHERAPDSIYRHILPFLKDAGELGDYLTKAYIPLYNVNFTVRDDCPQTPEKMFLQYYEDLHMSRFGITILRTEQAMGSGTEYFLMKDRFGNQYRVFVQTESELLQYSHGVSMEDGIPGHIRHINATEPDAPQRKQIPVYLRNGKLKPMDEGSTCLDLAFRIHTWVGIYANYAIINGRKAKMPLSTRLQSGDLVEIKTYKMTEEPRANIRWFEYLHTRDAVKALSRWLEIRTETAAPLIPVFTPGKKKRFDIPMGTTVLELVILEYRERILEGVTVYLNKSEWPTDLGKVLRANDQVRVEFGKNGHVPEIEWFRIVKNVEVKNFLVRYFNQKE